MLLSSRFSSPPVSLSDRVKPIFNELFGLELESSPHEGTEATSAWLVDREILPTSRFTRTIPELFRDIEAEYPQIIAKTERNLCEYERRIVRILPALGICLVSESWIWESPNVRNKSQKQEFDNRELSLEHRKQLVQKFEDERLSSGGEFKINVTKAVLSLQVAACACGKDTLRVRVDSASKYEVKNASSCQQTNATQRSVPGAREGQCRREGERYRGSSRSCHYTPLRVVSTKELRTVRS